MTSRDGFEKEIYDRDIHALMLKEFQKVSGGYELIDYSALPATARNQKR